ncbi:uncharacterized protein LOC120122724 [Hibiscus syriacus]|uniref:uncharacterized protein LOC120122724 n=1 Tax=Hibiscus syriacus TaxID=106335 RepID=UPI00192187C1|nr:uncharacterized protein LOC120122724 [Hibiscus syriacus]
MKEHVQTSAEYNLEEEVDMFRALDPIVEEPIVGLDPMTVAMCSEDVITSDELNAAYIESFPNEQLLEVLNTSATGCGLDFETPVVEIDESLNQENELLGDTSFQKRVSSGCLSSMGSLQGAAIKPNFLDFPLMDFGSVSTMRRALSEGDIKVSLNYLCIFYKNRASFKISFFPVSPCNLVSFHRHSFFHVMNSNTCFVFCFFMN